MRERTSRRRDRVHGVDVASVVHGDDPDRAPGLDVVMVHGLGVSNRYPAPSSRRLARHHRVFAPDLPGVGRSSRTGQDLSMTQLADGLRDWMDVVGVGLAVVVGHSLGCQVVVQLAARHPDRVVAVVLACPAPDPSRGPWWQQAWRLLVDGFGERPAMLLVAATDYPRVGLGRMLRSLRVAARRRDQPNLGAIDQRTLVVRGGRDPLVSAGWARSLAEDFPDARLVTLPDAPHGLPCSAPEPFVEAIRTFVDELDSPPGLRDR